MYLEVIECLNELNMSIYGLPVIISFIAANVGEIINTVYSNLLFPREYENDPYSVFALTRMSIKIINVLTLYMIGHSTEKEVFILYYTLF